MAFDENNLLDQVNSLRVQLQTCQDQTKPILQRYRDFKANFGVKEKQDGSLEVDYDKFAKAIGIEGALELRKIIDETYRISGAPGEKPRLRVAAAAE